jgi:hypothetical protein
MFCSNCGTDIKDGSKFCHKCGNSVNTAPNQPPEKPAKSKRLRLVVIVASTAIVLLVGRALFFSNGGSENSGNSVGNIVNGGLFAMQGNRVYYSSNNAIYSMKADGTDRRKLCDEFALYINVLGSRIFYSGTGGIYSMKTNGAGKRKLCDDWAFYISVVGDRIYYSGLNEGIYSMKTDGTDKQELCDDSLNCITVVGCLI